MITVDINAYTKHFTSALQNDRICSVEVRNLEEIRSTLSTVGTR